MENNAIVRRMENWEHKKTRVLYEEVFREDSQAFIDYYYEKKCKDNRMYVVEKEDKICSMLHLNPYRVALGEIQSQSFYIVAVATRESSRHQGMMKRLLEISMQEMRREQIPFTFLMPAAEAIYHPFDFRFVYEQNRCEIHRKSSDGAAGFTCRSAGKEDLSELCGFAMNYWKRQSRAYALHTEAYFETLLAEQDCQNGEIAIIMREGKIVGYFFVAREEQTEIREAVIEEAYEQYLQDILTAYLKTESGLKVCGISEKAAETVQKIPLIMARVIDPASFVSGIRAREPLQLVFTLTDEFLPENTGTYEWRLDTVSSVLKKTEAVEGAVCVDAGRFTELVFGRISMEVHEFPVQWREKLKKIEFYSPSSFNEVV